jgi:hypothetical protein
MFKVGDTVEVLSLRSRAVDGVLHNSKVTAVDTRTYLTLADGYTYNAKACRKVAEVSEIAREAKIRAFERDLMPVRRNDPDTSKVAARKCRGSLRQRIRDAMTDVPLSWTGKEMAAALDCPLNSVTPRFAELRRAGVIEDSGVRRYGQIAWVLA